MKIQFILLILFVCWGAKTNGQSGLVLAVGASMGYTDNPATRANGEMLSGFHGSLSGRFGSNYWYVRPGIELHVIKLLPAKLLNPFNDKPAMYLLKVPVQLGIRLIKTDLFKLRVAGGMQFSYVTSIDDNTFNLDHNTITDTQFGALIGAGIDLGPMCFDVNFEKGITELYTNTGYTSDYIFISVGFFF